MKGKAWVDLGCGAGGPSATVARSLRVQLTGVDASPAALQLASDRHLPTLPQGSRFVHGEFDATGLPDSSAHGVMSTDALLFAAEYDLAFQEAARICRPGGHFVFTSFELAEPSVSLGGAGPIEDYRPYLERAGFAIESYEETAAWKPRMQSVFAGIIENQEQLLAELGGASGPSDHLVGYFETRGAAEKPAHTV